MGRSFKDYEHEGWNKKASQYERVTLPITRQGFEPILTSFGDLTGKSLLDGGRAIWRARRRRAVH
jgi:hypothetical protein